MKKRALVIVAGASLAIAGCGSRGASGDDPVSRLFEDHYPEFVASAKAHHAGCSLTLSAKGSAGTKHDDLTSSVDVDANGNYRLNYEDGAELDHVGLRTWTKNKDGKVTMLEAGAQPDLARDAAVAEWRSLLEPLKERLRMKRSGSGKLGSRATEIWDVSFDTSGSGDAPKVEKGAGKLEIDEETGFPVKVDLAVTWSAKAADPSAGRVTYTLDKMGCAVTQLGAVEPIPPAEAVPGSAASPAPTAKSATTTEAAKATPAATPKAEKRDAKPGTKPGKSGKKPK